MNLKCLIVPVYFSIQPKQVVCLEIKMEDSFHPIKKIYQNQLAHHISEVTQGDYSLILSAIQSFDPPQSEQATNINVDEVNVNEIPSVNKPSNLKWVTPSENVQLSHDNGNRKSNAPKRSKPILGRKKNNNKGEWIKYPSMSEAGLIRGLH